MLKRFLLALSLFLANGVLLAETAAPLLKAQESPVSDIIEGSCQRTLDRNLDAVQVLSGYCANSFASYADPDNGSALEIIVEDDLSLLLPLLINKMKKEVVQTQISYNSLQLQGLTPLQWFLLSREIPSKNTFTFHRTLQNFEELYRCPAIKSLLGDLNHSLLFFRKEAIKDSWQALGSIFDGRKSAQGKHQETAIQVSNSINEAISFSTELGRTYLNGSGTSYNRMAIFFSVIADTLWQAKQRKGDLGAFAQLVSLLADLRLVTWRLGQAVTLDGKYDIDSRVEDFIERSVREALIYNVRLFKKGVAVQDPVNPLNKEYSKGMFLLRKLEIVQSRLLQIQSIQRRALRALSEVRRIEGKSPQLGESPLWMYGDLRAHLHELLRELDACVYGQEEEYVAPGSVEGLLFSPVMKGEILSVVTMVPQSTSLGGGVVSSRDEVFRLLHRIKKDHNTTIVPFLRERSQFNNSQRLEFARGEVHGRKVSKGALANRLPVVMTMLVSGRSNDGGLLSPEQMDYLRLEDFRLWSETGVCVEISGSSAPASENDSEVN